MVPPGPPILFSTKPVHIMAPTIKEIAERAQVSIATVSRVYSNDPKVAKKTRERILLIAEEMNYSPNILARNFARKQSNLIGLILPEISDEFFTEIIKGVDEVAYSKGYFTIVTSSHKYIALEDELLTFTQNGLLGGMILLLPDVQPRLRAILEKSRIPLVIINSGSRAKDFNVVAIDNYHGSFELTNHVLTKKKRKLVAYISGPEGNADSDLRKEGFLSSCNENGIAKNQRILISGDFTKAGGKSACKRLLSAKNTPDVIIAANDMMALGCYEHILDTGLRIPEDIAVVGFDDIYLAQYVQPPLTTVKIEINDVGRKAAEMLLHSIENDGDFTLKRADIPTRLVIRSSC